MNEARLTTIEQIEQFLSASNAIEFSAAGDEGERYVHISGVLKRFDYRVPPAKLHKWCGGWVRGGRR